MPQERFYWGWSVEHRPMILDRERSLGDREVARATDQEMAARIVRLLNADVEAAARQGAVVP